MIFQNLGNIETIDAIIIVCHLAVISSLVITGIVFYFKAKDQPRQVRNYILGLCLFALIYSASRLIMFLFELTFEPDFVWRIPVDEFDKIFEENPELAIRHDIIWRITSGLNVLGLTILMYQLETFVLEKKSKYFFTISQIVTGLPALIFGVTQKDALELVKVIFYIGNALGIVIPLIYFYFAKKTSDATRRRAIGAGIGILVMFLGVIFNGSLGKSALSSAFGIQGLYMVYYLYGILVPVGLFIYLKSIQY